MKRRPRVPSGTRPSPNIWHHTQVYETENLAVDRAGVIWSRMRSLADWTGRDVLDVGCGTGFHLPRFAADARSVVGVEPHPDLVRIAQRRVRRTPRVAVLQGTAQSLPLPDRSVDVAHARWAYFFGPGCEPGLLELARVIRPGGRAFVIDNDPDPERSTFGRWFREGYPDLRHDEVAPFWRRQGWERHRLLMHWTFDTREDLEAVVGIEFAPEHARRFLSEHEGTTVDYGVHLWSRSF